MMETLDTDWFTKPLYDMDAQEAHLAEAVHHQRLPSAYLVTGMQGIGKATLGTRLAAALLAAPQQEEGLFGEALPASAPRRLQVDADSPILTRMAQGSHPDFLWIRPPYDEKKKVWKKDIPIDRIRAIGEFMALTAGEGSWKVVVIDPAEAMNQAAANALLKWLEEPPARSVFVLISHMPGALLPTIRSRCRVLSVPSPSYETFGRMVQHDDAQALFCLSGGSPGVALEWEALGAMAHWEALIEHILSGADALAMLALAERMAKDEQWTIRHLQRLLDVLIRQVARHLARVPIAPMSARDTQAIEALAMRHSLHVWLELWERQHRELEAASGLYLDRRQVMGTMLTPLAAQ